MQPNMPIHKYMLLMSFILTLSVFSHSALAVVPENMTISIASGATYTNVTLNVVLNLSADGAENCTYSNNGTTWVAWGDYNETRLWNLSSGADGIRTVYYVCNNSEGNSSVVNDTILADTSAPANQTISIASGATYISSASTTLTLYANDSYSIGLGTVECRYNNTEEAWTSWEAYSTSKSWTLNLSAGNGDKIVSYQCRDGANNTGAVVNDTIHYDNGTVTLSTDSTLVTPGQSILVTATVYDPDSLVNHTNISGTGVSGTVGLTNLGSGSWANSINALYEIATWNILVTEYDDNWSVIRQSSAIEYTVSSAGAGGNPSVIGGRGAVIEPLLTDVPSTLPKYIISVDSNLVDFDLYLIRDGVPHSKWGVNRGDVLKLPKGEYTVSLFGKQVSINGVVTYYTLTDDIDLVGSTSIKWRLKSISEDEYNKLKNELDTSLEKEVLRQESAHNKVGSGMSLVLIGGGILLFLYLFTR